MEFTDMAKVAEVDPRLIERTRQWLLSQRSSDGSWKPESHALHEDPTRGAEPKIAILSTTAYIAWGVFADDQASNYASRTRDFILSHQADEIKDPYVLALVANALLVLDKDGKSAAPYLDRLEGLKRLGENGKFAWWEQDQNGRTMFYGAARRMPARVRPGDLAEASANCGSVETTALATLALVRSGRHNDAIRGALAWLVSQKDASGTWYSTQATVLALKALLAGTERPQEEKERRILVKLGEKLTKEIVIPADHSEVLKQLDLTPFLGAGRQVLEVSEPTKTGSGYQVSLRYHMPEARNSDDDPLRIQVSYDKKEVPVNGTIKATARVINAQQQNAPMLVVELPVPAGFVAETNRFNELIQNGRIARFQVQGGKVLVYLRNLAPGRDKAFELEYVLRATLPVKVAVPGARVYEYYAPERQGTSAATALVVQGR
jgi:hypothetical protein